MPSAPNVAVRRFAVVGALSLSAKIAGIALFFYLLVRLAGGT
ncbi:MAG: hypothetical protein ACLQD8_03405 [Thermoplasmata archaeon]